MSIAALLTAARDRLRQKLVFPGGPSRAAQYVGIQYQGRPPRTCGDWYIGLDESRVESSDTAFLKEMYSIDVIISRKTGIYAPDQTGEIYLDNLSGLDVLERQVISAIHGRQEVRLAANVALGLKPPDTSHGDGFQKPLYYPGRGRTVDRRDPEWTGSPSDSTFLVRTLPFRGGARIQSLEIMK